MEMPDNWKIFETAEEVALESVAFILKAAAEAIEAKGVFHLVTAGGTTPLRCYQLLAEQTLPEPEKWHIYIGDERCVPVDHQDRNSLALAQAWLEHSKIPKQNWHFMQAEQGANQAAAHYRTLVEGVRFDVVMLGMGEDGHTASLFPNHLYPQDSVVTEFNAPKMPPERVSLSVEKLSDANCVLKLITGKSKQPILSEWLMHGDFPIVQVSGQTTWVLLDRLACPVI